MLFDDKKLLNKVFVGVLVVESSKSSHCSTRERQKLSLMKGSFFFPLFCVFFFF